MGAELFTDWTAENSADVGKKPYVTRHNIHERLSYSDEGLATLLDTYPREKLGVYTMGNDPEQWGSFVSGDAGDLSGAQIVEAVKRGRIWLNLRAVNQEMDEYAELCRDIFDDFRVKSGERTFKQDLGILISSPNAQVFYHLDIPLVLLWQLRGTKRVWIYPNSSKFIRDDALEGIVLKEKEEEVAYSPEFDQDAFVVDLQPGMVANWPQMAPHRIENHDMLNVSLSIEYMTLKGLANANMLYTNGVLRRKWGRNPNRLNDTGIRMWGKAIAARAMKAAGARDVYKKDKVSQFKINLSAENCVEFFEPAKEMA